MRNAIWMALVVLASSLPVVAGCRKPEAAAKAGLKNDIADIKAGGEPTGKTPSYSAKPKSSDLTKDDKAGGAKNKDGDPDPKTDADPFKAKAPDPKIAEQKKAEKAKQSTLAQLCRDAFSPMKDTRRTALTQLERDYAELEKHVRTLTINTGAGELKGAFEAIGKMGPSVQGAWVGIDKGMERALANEDGGIADVMSAGIDGFVKIAPGEAGVVKKLIELARLADVPAKDKLPGKDRSGIRKAAVTALSQVAPLHPSARQREMIQALKATANDAKDPAHLPAIRALGAVAKACPMVRGDVDAALQGSLSNSIADARQAAVQALFLCGARVSAKTRGILDDLKDDPQINVRDAVSVTLKEIGRQTAVVSQLDKARILEGEMPALLFQACFALVEGVETKAAIQTLREAPHELDAWTALTGLARVDKEEVRTTALTILGDWARPEENFRSRLVPIFLLALKDKGTADVGRTGLIRCSAETVRQLKAAKSDIDLNALFRGQGDDSDPYVALGICEGLAELRVTAKADLEPLFYYAANGRDNRVTRAAAKALLHLGPDQMEHAEVLNDAYVGMKDEITAKDLAKIIENMGFQAGAGRFQSSLLLHPKVAGARKNKTITDLLKEENFSSSVPTSLSAFGREADAKAKEMVIERWLEDNKGRFVKDRKGESEAAQTYTKEALLLCTLFRVHAKKLAPILADSLQDYANSKEIAFLPKLAAEALGYIGPGSGVDSRKALELASRARPLGERQFEDQVRAAAKNALLSFPLDPPALGLSKEEVLAGFELLFNGKDFTGWSQFRSNYNEAREVHFGINAGSLHTQPQRPKTGGRIPAIGFLTSDAAFKNFILRLDVMLEERTQSAIRIRTPAQGDGIAIQIQDNETAQNQTYKHGAIANLATALTDDVPTDAWHAMEIHANGPVIQVKLNGKLISQTDVKLNKQATALQAEGRIVLISNGGRAEFRNVRVKKLP